MEMWHKGATLCTVLQHLVSKQVGLNAADAIALYTLYCIQCLNQIQECLTCSLAKITYINARYHYFLSTQLSSFLSQLHQRLYAAIPTSASGKGNGTIGTIVITTVLNL